METSKIHKVTLNRIWKRSSVSNQPKKFAFDGNRITFESLTDDTLKNFWREFRKIPQACELKSPSQNLSLFFSRCHDITFLGMKFLFQNLQLRYFEQLETLNIRFWCSRGTTDQSLEAIGYGISRNLSNLKHLKLNFIECHSITDKGVDRMGHELSKNLKSLKSLDISFRHCRQLTGRSLSKIGSDIGRNLHELESIEFACVLIQLLDDKSMTDFVSSIEGKLNNLKHIGLDLGPSREMTDDGLMIFGKKMADSFKNLERLDLKLSGFVNITDQGIDGMICPLFQSLKNLMKLKLSLESCPGISNKSLVTIGTEIGTNLSSLKNLEINLKSLTGNVDGEGFELLNKHIFKELKNLETFTFNSNILEDRNLESLAANLICLKELKQLTVDISHNQKLTRRAIMNFFTQTKKNLTELVKVSINLAGVNRETAQDFSALKFEEDSLHAKLKR